MGVNDGNPLNELMKMLSSLSGGMPEPEQDGIKGVVLLHVHAIAKEMQHNICTFVEVDHVEEPDLSDEEILARGREIVDKVLREVFHVTPDERHIVEYATTAGTMQASMTDEYLNAERVEALLSGQVKPDAALLALGDLHEAFEETLKRVSEALPFFKEPGKVRATYEAAKKRKLALKPAEDDAVLDADLIDLSGTEYDSPQ